jgi:hypothetical protein
MLEFIVNLNRFKENLEKEFDSAIKDALYHTGVIALERAEKLAPIDRGDLIRSMGIAVSGRIKLLGSGSESTPDVSGMDKYELRISANTSYAYEVHEFYDEKIPGEKSSQKWGIPRSKQKIYGWKFLARALNNKDTLDQFARFLDARLD